MLFLKEKEDRIEFSCYSKLGLLYTLAAVKTKEL